MFERPCAGVRERALAQATPALTVVEDPQDLLCDLAWHRVGRYELDGVLRELVAGGENQYRLDFSWPAVRFTAEVEGCGPHSALQICSTGLKACVVLLECQRRERQHRLESLCYKFQKINFKAICRIRGSLADWICPKVLLLNVETGWPGFT